MWTGLTGVLIGAGELVTHWGVFEQFDRHVTAWVVAHRSHALDATMKAITWCGSWIAVAVTGGILVVLVAVRKLALVVLMLAAAAWVGEVTSVNLAKSLVDRQRPPRTLWLVTAHGASFPSGHAANATLVFATLGLLWCLIAGSWAARVPGEVVSVLGILTVGFSRVELGVHWTTDVLASFLVVAAWVLGVGLLFANRLLSPASHSSPSGRSAQRSGHRGAPEVTPGRGTPENTESAGAKSVVA